MNRMPHLCLAAALLGAFLYSGAGAVEGYIVMSNTGWVSDILPEGSWMVDLATGDTTRISPNFWRCGSISPDGREVVGYLWDGWEIMNNDGTGRRMLMTADHDQYMNQGWLNRAAFTDQGVWWLATDANFTYKRLMFADRYTGQMTMAADLSAYGDAVQGVFMSNDGLKGTAWLHEETVTISFTSHLANPVVRSMTGVWGHGPTMPSGGDAVIISAFSADRDLGAGNPDHRTWVVYDWATGVLGDFEDRYAASSTGKTKIGGQWVVRNNPDYMIYESEDGKRYLLNWRTHETTLLPIPAGGSVFDAWLGPLPNVHTDPTLGLSPASLQFVSAGGDPASQNVNVNNRGGGTLDNVTASIAPAGASAWLSVTRSGTGNSQTLVNAVAAAALANGTHTATVTVSATGLVIAPSSAAASTSPRPAGKRLGAKILDGTSMALTGPAGHRISAALFTLHGRQVASCEALAGSAVALPLRAGGVSSPLVVRLTDLQTGAAAVSALTPSWERD